MSSDAITPVNGIGVLIDEVRELKTQCQKIADNGLQQLEELPKLRREIRNVKLFQAWFPTFAISAAIIFRLIFMR